MDPVVFLVAALTGVGAFTGWLVRAYIAHLESDISYSRRTAIRGTEIAEKAVSAVEKVA